MPGRPPPVGRSCVPECLRTARAKEWGLSTLLQRPAIGRHNIRASKRSDGEPVVSDPAGDEPAHRLWGRKTFSPPPRSLHYSFVSETFAPVSSLASCAQRNPIQLILVFGSVPFRMAARIVVVLSIQPPPRKAF